MNVSFNFTMNGYSQSRKSNKGKYLVNLIASSTELKSPIHDLSRHINVHCYKPTDLSTRLRNLFKNFTM